MKKIDWSVSFHTARLDELDGDVKDLIDIAFESREQAYAPYSFYKVGAAVRLEDQTVIRGNNQENAAYPSGLCAERVALFHAGAVHPDKKVRDLAIVTRSNGALPAASCGSCRQVMLEFEHRQTEPIRIIMADDSGNVLIASSVKDLLPLSFEPDRLG